MSLPLLIGGVCVITSIIGTYFVRLGKGTSIMGAMYKGFGVTAVLSAIAIFFATRFALGDLDARRSLPAARSFTGMDLYWCMLLGLVITGLIIWITEYYTGTNYRPVRSIAKASETGHGTNVIQGLAISLESTALPTLVICAGIIIAFLLAGPDGDRLRGDRHAGAGRHGRRARRLRPGHRQRRRHRRNVGAGRKRPRKDRCARRGRQHHQGGDQGLCDRIGRPCRARAVRRLHHRPARVLPRPRRSTSAWRIRTSSSGCCSAPCCPICSGRWG